MIDTKTTWEDSGYDCQFCGVQILKRTDIETGQPAKTCFQGERGCQWSLDGELIRVGHHPACRKAQKRQNTSDPSWDIPRWVWIVVGVFFLFTTWRFGGFVALRYMVPVVLVVLAVTFGFKYGRQQEWW